MQLSRFKLSSEDCELLLAFEDAGSLVELAGKRGRDLSVISRQIQNLAAVAPVLEKRGGRWSITQIGKEFCQWSRKSIQEQNLILSQTTSLRIAGPTEFVSRVLIPSITDLIPKNLKVHVELTSQDISNVEHGILSGQIDWAFECGRPENPEIKFRLLKPEPLSVVASQQFFKEYKFLSTEDLTGAPHIRYTRINPNIKLKLSREISNIPYTFDTIAAVRSAAIQGLGWALLPIYTIQNELASKTLRPLYSKSIDNDIYGIWWSRNNRIVGDWIERAITWLKQQDLGQGEENDTKNIPGSNPKSNPKIKTTGSVLMRIRTNCRDG